MDTVLGYLASNWDTALVAVLAGGWLVKIRVAVSSIKKLVEELRQDKAALENALADNTITEAEAQEIARELGETLVALHAATASLMSMVPAKWRSKVPVQLQSGI